MERRSKSLQQMFYDAQDIQHNIQACKQIQTERLNAQECENEYGRKGAEHRIDNTRGPLAFSYANDSAKNYIPLLKEGVLIHLMMSKKMIVFCIHLYMV
jgi:hypothetical protein